MMSIASSLGKRARYVDQPRAVRILDIRDECDGIRTFDLEASITAEPGQFVMVWIPRVDLIPLGVSAAGSDTFSITVSDVGEASHALHQKKVGEFIGYQGPYGKPFTLHDSDKNIALVAGGYGVAPLGFLAKVATEQGKTTHLIEAARTQRCLYTPGPIRGENHVDIRRCTDDGTVGEKGLATDVLDALLAKEKIDHIYACGPELMLVTIATMAVEKNIPCQVSLERMMKCGFGVCGQCAVDDEGLCVCQDGPVFTATQALTITEFGKYHRTASGRIVER